MKLAYVSDGAFISLAQILVGFWVIEPDRPGGGSPR